jgi:pimeloyl-ACP methyl ester carboxylesterase
MRIHWKPRAWACLLPSFCLLAACAGGANAPEPPSAAEIQTATAAAARPGAAEVIVAPATFDTGDGVALAGTLYGSGEVVALLAHMSGATQASWRPFAERVAQAGYAAFTFDFRGNGASGGPAANGLLDQDVRAAIAYLRGQGFKTIVLIGASMGGTAAAMNSRERNVAGLSLISSPRGFEGLVVAPGDLAGLPYPKQFIASEDDEPFVTEVRTMHSQASDPKEIRLFSGNAHGTNLFNTDHKAEFETLLLSLIQRAAGDL